MVECHLAKVKVASSNLVSRSTKASEIPKLFSFPEASGYSAFEKEKTAGRTSVPPVAIFHFFSLIFFLKLECVFQAQPLGILVAEVEFGAVFHLVALAGSRSLVLTFDLRPLDADLRIVPGQTALIARMIEVRNLVAELCLVAQYEESMRKALGDVELLLVLGTELNTVPLSVRRASGTKVDRYVKNRTTDDADKFALREFLLEMQSTEHALGAHALVVLYKYHIQTLLMHVVLVIGLYEIAAAVAMYCRLDYKKSLDRGFGYFDLSHLNTPYSAISFR